MFSGKKLKVSRSNDTARERFANLTIPTSVESLTASYSSTDWRTSDRLTFFRFATDATDAPFLPGLMTAPARHDGDK